MMNQIIPKRVFAILVAIVTLTFLSGVSILPTSNAESNNLSSSQGSPIIISNQVYINGDKFTDSPEEKVLPVLSQDGTKIAFAYSLFNGPVGKAKIGVIDLINKKVIDIILDDHLSTSWKSVLWMDNKRIGVIGKVNPSTDEFSLIELADKTNISTYYGLGFIWDSLGQELLYNETKPHFGEGDKGNNKIINSEGHIYYESPSNVLILGGPNIDSEGKQIAFFEADLSSETINLVLANKDSNVNKLQGINKIKWSGSIGKIEWKTNELITVHSRYKLIDYNIEQQTVTNEIDTPEKIKLDKENQEKIDRAILK